MPEPFPVSGNIDPQSFPHLLVDLHRHGATGSLKVNGPVHPKALYFRGGRVLFGSSNDPRDQLGAILIESGRITRDQLDEVNAKVGPGNPLAKVLAESGFVNQRELGEAARMKVERILADVLAWDSGTFEFEDGVLPKGAVDLKLSTEKLLLAAVQRVSDRPFALRHLELSSVLEPVREGEAALSEVRADVWPLLERLDGRRTLKDAIALTRLDEFEAVKTACAMLFLGIVRKTEGVTSGGEVDLAEQAQSGFAQDDASMYTVPLNPVAAADLPASSGFAFTESAPSFVPPEPEPAPVAGVPPAAPASFPEVEPVPDEPPVFMHDTTMLPSAAPIFTMADYLKRAEAETKAEERMAFEPKSEELPPETLYAPPSPPPVSSSPAPVPESEAETLYAPASSHTEVPVFAPEPPGETVYNPFTATVPATTIVVPGPEPEPEPPAPSYAAYGASASEPPAGLPEPAVASPSPASRPSQEDLAALDALLNPAAAAQRSSPERPRQEKFEPQFRPATTPPRRAGARNAPSAGSRVPLIAAGLAGVLLATVAAWFFLLRTPEVRPAAPVAPPTTLAAVPTTTLPPATLAPSPSPSVAPAAAATPAPIAAVAAVTPLPAPLPTPRAAATQPPRVAAQGAGDGRSLLKQGSFPEAARSFASSLAPGARGRFSQQLLTACSTDTIAKAVQAVPEEELFILPVTFQGRSCYRLCWGVYDSRAAAEAARRSVPAYFTQAGTTPRLSPLNELIP
jgi:hypothetical protein